jgi:putative Holliday junction resolvase
VPRVLGVDLGERRVGLALSDPTATYARPLLVVERGEPLWRALAKLIAEEEVGRVVIGLPLNMDGSTGPKAREALAFKQELEKRTGLPAVTWDERLTTVEAEGVLRAAGLSARKRAERVDKVAAQIILQSYLDRERSAAGPGEGPAGSS